VRADEHRVRGDAAPGVSRVSHSTAALERHLLVLVDLFVVPELDLRVFRTAVATVSLLVLVHGLVGESK
jgi:hypothetical protein